MAPNRGGRKPFVYCEGSPTWTPDSYLADTALHARAEAALAERDDLQGAITESFALPRRRGGDPYVYHAMVSVTLPQVQHVVGLGRANGLHDWYRDLEAKPDDEDEDGAEKNEEAKDENKEAKDENKEARKKPPPHRKPPPPPLPPPPRADTDAYLAIFSPTTSTPAALTGLRSNAKKGSLRAAIAAHLLAKRYIHPGYRATLGKLPKARAAPPNPYLGYLGWACRALEWAGPCGASERAGGRGHAVLPVLMHHFGCACPSHEALGVLRHLAAGREVLDLGSGNGYWTRLLRAYGVRATPVDSAQSAWRATWVGDTVVADGARYLAGTRAGAPDAVLLLVYPIVGGGVAGGEPGGFTRGMLAAYAGDTLAVVGTQNRNGYTGFRGEPMDAWMAREHGDEWTKVVQVALPSFPGKDEALFVFQRGDRAPKAEAEGGEGKTDG
ncbi:hypothetical protein F4780DRAFT_792992 [Xylariomycetidae sp. FL0641]|nr:hypothetical protein F4780DRAFT_792992 [Xylariomycetidae sp. FL0641]